jgi:hypothetical protein
LQQTDAQERIMNTNKDDRCRLLHLFADTNALPYWSDAFTPLERSQLDVRDFDRGYTELARMFNDYDGVQYQNVVIEYDPTTKKPYIPFKARSGFEQLARLCWELNPQDSLRPQRDADWIRVTMKDMRSRISIIFANYSRSGNHEAENVYDEWLNFCGNSPIVYAYSRAVIDPGLMDQMGKALPLLAGRDTGGGPSTLSGQKRVYSDSPSATSRRHQRMRKSQLQGSGSSGSITSPDETSSGGLAEMLKQHSQRSIQKSELEYVLSQDIDPQLKKRAWNKILQLAGLEQQAGETELMESLGIAFEDEDFSG